uniref:DNA-directed RNA polymerase n=1 Tax=Strigamia maritima TaxID=126957 RepID=T1JHH9_STRMM
MSDARDVEEQDVDKQRNEHLKRVQRNLLPFLDVKVNSNMKNEAFKSLNYYHYQYQSYGIPLDNIKLYICLLESCAVEGDWVMCKKIMELIAGGNVKINLQAFMSIIECAYRADKHDVISGILENITTSGFDINDMLIECNFVRDQKEVVLKAIRTQIPSFEPKRRVSPIFYNCKLLEHLNEDMPADRFYSPLGPPSTTQIYIDRAKEQLEAEERCFKIITNFDHNSELSKEKTEVAKKVRKYVSKWNVEMLLVFQEDVNQFRMKSASSNGILDIMPYFCCLKPEEYVEIMYREFLSVMLSTDQIALDLRGLHRLLGCKVMDKYFLQTKMQNGVVDHTLKLYKEYCEYYVNPELTSRFTARQYWELLREKYYNGPDIEPVEHRWPRDIITEVGKRMFSIMQRVIKFDLNFLENTGKPGVKNLVSPFFTALTINEENGAESRDVKRNRDVLPYCELLDDGTYCMQTTYLPMLCPPIPWTSVSSGGFLINHTYSSYVFLRGTLASQHELLKGTNKQDLFPYFDSVNHITDTPWLINKQVLKTAIEVFKRWNPSSEPVELNAEKKRLATLLLGVRRGKQQSETSVLDIKHKFSVAIDLCGKVFWFPHSIDFRGRMYPIATYFSYQMTDVDRGLLLFAKGEPLGKDGLDWLKIHLTNSSGGKKRCSLKEKIEYCDEMLPEIMDSADNPLEGNGWWQKCSNPWQTLASCIELTSALRSPDPHAYVSHFPVHQDGSCNGLQHYAALARDLEAAKHVNLEPHDVPRDFYTRISTELEEARKKDADNGNQVAMFLDGLINRQFIKMPVMAMIYGTSRSGHLPIVKQLNDISEFSVPQQRIAADYLAEKIQPIFETWFTSVKGVTNWFSKSGNLISHIHEKPVEWVTPIGLPVCQPYFVPGRRFRVERVIPTKESNTLKQSQSFSSNFIHSLDATHLILTNLYCQRRGIPFVSIHDSYWTHSSRINEMNKICREQFVALHSEPLLENLSEHLKQRFCRQVFLDNEEYKSDIEALKQILSKVPDKGSFDLSKVLESTFGQLIVFLLD